MSKLYGYNGKIAYINLSTSKIDIKDLDPKIVEEYLGGAGLSAKLTYDFLSESDYEVLKENPLSSINPIIFATGPLTGTATPSSSRYCVSGISPLTGIWGEATSGGFFPIALKRSGYDAIIITGESDTPKLIYISNGEIEIKGAEPLWGKNTQETTESIKDLLNDEKLRVACIGKAGENLVKYAAIINDEGRAAGRCGLGAIMGAKKLKAIVLKGGQPIDYSDKEQLRTHGMDATEKVMIPFATNMFSHYGTLIYTDMGMVLGDVPANYFTNTEFIAEDLTGRALKEQFVVLKYACAGCTIGCGRRTLIEINGEETEVDGPEYETTAAYGPLCGIYNFKPIILADHACNLEGVDTISSGVSIAFLIYLVENNIATTEIAKFLDKIPIEEIRWGKEETVLKLLNKIIMREGIGDLLAEGVKKMAEKLGVDPGLAAHVKGLEMPMHDPRAYLGQALSYMTSCTGANHNKGDFYNIDGDAASYSKIRKKDRFTVNKREKAVIAYQDLTNIYDSAVICNFTHINEVVLTRLLKASTGIESFGSSGTLYKIGERASNLKRLISCKLGCKREDDYLPKILSTALETGGSAGIAIDLEENLKEYYNKRGWDWETGFPKKETLEKLGITKS
ncbi:MAG: aldehyde ferredoxin oxidoreductase family protein [Candidatus Bathyarchaeota archaeon]|nr:aldehyde ferredoxin oxidoreductase family protein [Candidatus Bathyarchaeota archaeon]